MMVGRWHSGTKRKENIPETFQRRKKQAGLEDRLGMEREHTHIISVFLVYETRKRLIFFPCTQIDPLMASS